MLIRLPAQLKQATDSLQLSLTSLLADKTSLEQQLSEALKQQSRQLEEHMKKISAEETRNKELQALLEEEKRRVAAEEAEKTSLKAELQREREEKTSRESDRGAEDG